MASFSYFRRSIKLHSGATGRDGSEIRSAIEPPNKEDWEEDSLFWKSFVFDQLLNAVHLIILSNKEVLGSMISKAIKCPAVHETLIGLFIHCTGI